MNKQILSKYTPIIIFFVLFTLSPILAFIVAGLYIYKYYKGRPQASAQPNKPRKESVIPTVEYKFSTDSNPTHIFHPDNHMSDYNGLDPYLQQDIQKHNKRYKGMSDLLQ